MARVPLTEEQEVTEDFVVLNLENIALSDEQFVELCCDNRDFRFELTAQKELVIMTPPGPQTGHRNASIDVPLGIWAGKDGSGLTFSSGTIFSLPNGAKRGPDASWVRRETWDAFTEVQKEGLPCFCPDFVVELMSPSDRRPVRFRMVQAKMVEYIENGARLGWLIDPFQKKVYICRPGQPVECVENPESISGEPVLPGFALQMNDVWQ